MKSLYLFDLDGTLCLSTKTIHTEIINKLEIIKKKGNEIGIVGGGKFETIYLQINDLINFDYIFSECGCVFHKYDFIQKKYNLIYKKNIREHKIYPQINILIKKALLYLSNVDYQITGNFIDLRNGLIYISLIGISANNTEREYFINLDKQKCYRKELLNLLKKESKILGVEKDIEMMLGGNAGISISPIEWNKEQVLEIINIKEYNKIYYFGDRYDIDGNDYNIINNKNIIGVKVDSPKDTEKNLENIIKNYID